MKKAITLLAVSVSGIFAGPFTNGSFEIGPDPGGSFIILSSGDTSITGWEVLGPNTIDLVGTVWQNSDGLKGIDLDGTPGPGGIQQTFDTMIGTQYSVLFDLAGNPVGGPTIKEVEVSAAGVDAIYTFDVTGKSLAAMGWVTKEFKFVATSTSTTLAFRSLTSSGNWGPALDNVRVSAVPTGVVPEPQTYAMMAAGIAALVAFGRRRS